MPTQWNYRCLRPAYTLCLELFLDKRTVSGHHTGVGFNVSILGGFDECQIPLESIKADDYVRDEEAWARRKVLPPLCRTSRGISGFGPVLASMALPVLPMPMALPVLPMYR